MLRFIFGEGTDAPDAQTLAQRREIVNQLARRSLSNTPRNLGEGLSAIGEALAYRFQDRRLSGLESEERQRIADMLGGMGMGGGMGAVPGMGGSGIVAPQGPAAGADGRSTAAVANALAQTGAPTTGAIPRLPATSTMAGDPRRGMFATGQELIDDPNVFTTRIGGATGGVSPELLNIIGNSTEQMVGPGAEVMVTSGLRPGSVGSQHSAGQAADFGVRMPGRDAEGRAVLPGMDAASGRERLNYASPEIYDIARMAVSDGASGIGIGPTYMGGDVFHFDTGRGGGSAPNFGGAVRTWSDWNRTGPRGASDPMGAGDPRFGFQQELQGIRNAREMPVGGALTASAGAPSPQMPSAPTGAMPAPQGMPQIGFQQFAEIMGNPYVTDGQRAIAQALMSQQMQAMDPMRQLQMQQLQLQVQAMQNPQAEPMARLVTGADAEAMGLPPGAYNILPDGRISQIADAPAALGGFRPATPEESAVFGGMPGQIGPDGRFYPVNAPSGMTIESDGQGGFRMVQGSGVGGGDVRFTEGQSRDNVYATRAEGALAALDGIDQTLTNRTELLAESVPLGFGRAIQTPEFQQARAAGREFLQAILRKDTGAAITTQEVEEYGSVYLPQPGDTPEMLAWRRTARQRALEALRSGMNADQMATVTRALAASTPSGPPSMGGLMGAGDGQQLSPAPAQGQAPTAAQIRTMEARDLISLDTSQLGAAEMRALQERLEELSRE